MGGLSGGASGSVGTVVLGQVEWAWSGAVEMGAVWDSDSKCFSSLCDGGSGDSEESGANGEGGDGGKWAAARTIGLFEYSVNFCCGVQCNET